MIKRATARLGAAFFFRLVRCVAAASTVFVLMLALATAQQPPSDQTLSLYIGQTVSSVEVAGQPDVTFDSVRNLIMVKQGQPLTQNDVDATIKALQERGGFQNAHLDIEPAADGVQVKFILQPAVYVAMYEFPGAIKEFSYSRLLQVANYQSQAPYSLTDVQQADAALVQFFRELRLLPCRSTFGGGDRPSP
jgi:outer membrane protein assembly factor BamA